MSNQGFSRDILRGLLHWFLALCLRRIQDSTRWSQPVEHISMGRALVHGSSARRYLPGIADER